MHEYDFSLGNHHFEVTTASALAQRWFDRGLLWIYDFNHNEAAACFRKVAKADPQLAMAYWGEAYACGPFYNMTWDKFSGAEAAEATAVCHAATRTAQRLAPAAPGVEQALIEALCARFQKPKPVSLEQFDQWEDDYVMAMRQVYDRYPDHCDLVLRSLDYSHSVAVVECRDRRASCRRAYRRSAWRHRAGDCPAARSRRARPRGATSQLYTRT